MADEDIFSQTPPEFGKAALQVLDGAKHAIESLKDGYIKLDRYPPGGGGAAIVLEPIRDEHDAIAPILRAIKYLRDFTEAYYINPPIE